MPVKAKSRSASDYLPPKPSLPALVKAARHCEGCDLYKHATQTVFGEGLPEAVFMLVGEQPGDQEDLAGRPFVGPAGRLLRESLESAGIDLPQVYLTNTVKHFKFKQTGKRRMHVIVDLKTAREHVREGTSTGGDRRRR